MVFSQVNRLKKLKRNEATELIVLMLLNKKCSDELFKFIKKGLTDIPSESVSMSIDGEKLYNSIKELFETKYFSKDTEYEKRRKESILFSLSLDMFASIIKFKSIGKILTSNDYRFPLIEHKENENEITLKFDKDTPRKDIELYLKKILDLKNPSKKHRVSLVDALWLLEVDKKVRKNPDVYNQIFTYREEISKNRYNKYFNKNLSIENTQKLLQRIKRAYRDVNTKDIS
jgi:hypothetical protein